MVKQLLEQSLRHSPESSKCWKMSCPFPDAARMRNGSVSANCNIDPNSNSHWNEHLQLKIIDPNRSRKLKVVVHFLQIMSIRTKHVSLSRASCSYDAAKCGSNQDCKGCVVSVISIAFSQIGFLEIKFTIKFAKICCLSSLQRIHCLEEICNTKYSWRKLLRNWRKTQRALPFSTWIELSRWHRIFKIDRPCDQWLATCLYQGKNTNPHNSIFR